MQSNKSYSRSVKSYPQHLTGVLKFILLSFAVILLGFTTTNPTSALTYEDTVVLQFTWNPTIRISLSSADLVINNLTPGNSADSNTITINVGTNNMYGYTLSATAGNTTNASTNLVNTVDNTKLFTSLATDASLASLTTDNTWGYSFSTNYGTSWSNYSGLPLYTAAAGAELVNNDGSGSTPVQFKIAAKASTIQASGAYTNTINFTAVANPEPTPQPISCDAGKICYSPNALDSEGTMGEQTTDDENNALSNGSSVTLLASNYSRNGYGFAGWSTTMDGSGKIYGPNETITTGDLSSTGMPLYAIWVRSAGSMQDPTTITSVCNSLTKAPIDGTANLSSVSALTDQRDNQTYAIAKLADGKCWMIENLRLDNTAELTTTNTNNPLNDGTNVTLKHNYTDTDTHNTLSSTSAVAYNADTAPDGWCTTHSAACDDQSRLRTDNTANRATGNPNVNTGSMYSYGNYYNWYSATAGNGTYSYGTNNDSVGGDLCPTGWKLPLGNTSTGDIEQGVSDSANRVGGFSYLDRKMGGTGAYQYTSADSLRWRKFPINTLYSGYVYGGSLDNRGSNGNYWSSTTLSNRSAYSLNLSSSDVYPGTDGSNKYFGRTVRCIAQ